jgi:hypothetical protein
MEQNATPLLDAVWGAMIGRLAVPLLISAVVLLLGIILLMKTRNRVVFAGLFVLALVAPIIAFVSFIGFDSTVRETAKNIPNVKPERVDAVIDMAEKQPYYGIIASVPAIIVSGIGMSRKPRRDGEK